jgi:tRNA(fMet)-specific endonuclease VapC
LAQFSIAVLSSRQFGSHLENPGLDVLALEAPTDAVCGELRARLERTGGSIANDLLIAAHALASGHTVVTDNERELARIDYLRVENWLR